jgi:hypothetical protein
MAAPPMKPTIAAWDRKSIRNPNLINWPKPDDVNRKK